ncbi:hypothetical protein M9H77_16259 [Catharanthus roseus]|uniref:Uncharacterized protein n=1 Tax=Catharanthus roseus TaxID=4058 RepID=A0ACC0B1A7_CATRO|nr:hypothetical protein M9H77_16259 [Catharanthus roseus]
MNATHLVRVILFWDLEHARDAFGPYFTRAAKKTWTFTRMVTHNQFVRKIFKHQGMDLNKWHIRMTMMIPSFYEDMNNDDEMHYLWTIRPDISKEDMHVLPDVEEDDEHNDNANADYDVSSASDENNDMGSEEQIDDFIESGTIRLLDWNDTMTDLQLGMRFVDKI